MFRVSCPMCNDDLKILTPKTVTCSKCHYKFKPSKARMFFKVRCSNCGEIVEQPLKNINQHAVCPKCAESSFIPAPASYQKFLDQKKAEKEAEKEAKKAEQDERRVRKDARRKSASGIRRGKRGMSRKRMAVHKSSGQEGDAILYECGFCGAGISQSNIDREEAAQHNGLWYCWDHVPK